MNMEELKLCPKCVEEQRELLNTARTLLPGMPIAGVVIPPCDHPICPNCKP
jgi:hypothetical protein